MHPPGSSSSWTTALIAILLTTSVTLPSQAQGLLADGDFEAQVLDTAVGTPWGPVGGGNTVTAAAQSPYLNVYQDNGKGANFPASAGNPYIVGGFEPVLPGSDTTLYFNVDFRNNSAESGDYSLVITANAQGSQRSVAFYVTGDTLYAESSADGAPTQEAVLQLQTGVWYNLQATLDLASQTYTATITSPQDGASVSPRPFVFADREINCVYSDGGTSFIPGTAPDHDLDNWAVSTTPLESVLGAPLLLSTSPRGPDASASASVEIALKDGVTQVNESSIQLQLNGQAVTPVVSKPAGSDVTTITYTPATPFYPNVYEVSLVYADNATPPVSRTHQFSFTVKGVEVLSLSPTGPDQPVDTPVQIQLAERNTQLVTDSVRLLLNGQSVTPVIATSPPDNLITISYAPEGGFASGSSHTVELIFSDNSVPPLVVTNHFSFAIVNLAQAATVVNIDFNGVRNVPGPDVPGPTYSGSGAGGGGPAWNGILVDSRLEDGTDEDNLEVSASNLVNSLGVATALGFQVGPVGGDVGGPPTTDPTAAAALFSDYIFNNSAGNSAGTSPFTLSGLGDAPLVDLYFYKGPGTVSIPGSAASPFVPAGTYTTANTVYFRAVPVTDGTVTGVFGPGTTVINGLSVVSPLPQPFVKRTAPTGNAVPANAAIEIELQDYVTQVDPGSVTLFLNGEPVESEVTKAGAVTTVNHVPAALASGSTNVVTLVFADTATPPVSQTHEFTFVVVNEVIAAHIINIDFKGARNVPSPRDEIGPVYAGGEGAAGGGAVWNGIVADSRLEDGTDEDNLTIGGTDLLNSLGAPTPVSFTVSPVGGDTGGTPTTDPNSPAALLSDYFFNNSAGNVAELSPFTLSGLGDVATVNLYFYRGGGTVTVSGATSSATTLSGIFTAANTLYFENVPVSGGTVTGEFGPGTTVIYGMSIDANPTAPVPPGPLVITGGANVSLSWTGGGVLQHAEQIAGPWTDNPDATSPFSVTPTADAAFYQLRP